MTMNAGLGTRRSIQDIQNDYDTGKDKSALELLMRAWKGIKELPPEDTNSFFMLGGYHGEPFRGPGMTDPTWWGGYCQHGTALFPTWHRAYLHRLEKALQSIQGCESVMLPFWDECSEESQTKGIPSALTDSTFVLDGAPIANPLRSFVIPEGIIDRVQGDNPVYSKPAGYETVRYPLSGLVGTPADVDATKTHNAQYADPTKNVEYLNINIKNWLSGKVTIDGKDNLYEVHDKFVKCLDAPSYTLFSNTTSAKAWNSVHKTQITPLEQPHNYMHLAVGGFDYPGAPNQPDFSPIPFANGDMGENDTAGLDPIFFFHHCFIDYVFWIWQKRHGATEAFTIDPHDPGAAYSSSNDQPPAGANYGDVLSIHTPLNPFQKLDGSGTVATIDCINIENQLGYTYGPGSLDAYAQAPNAGMVAASVQPAPPGHTVFVSGVDRTRIRGSFLISAFATVDGKREYLGTEAILSRWHLKGCMNCQNHLEAKASFRLPNQSDFIQARVTGSELAAAAAPLVEVEIRTHEGLFGGGSQRPVHASISALAVQAAPYKVEIR